MKISTVRRTVLRSSLLALLAGTALGQTPAPALSSGCAAGTPKGKLNILLVGASGMIGSRILSEATSRGHCVIGAARRPEKISAGPNVRAVKLDATDKDALAALAKNGDVIVMATSPRSGGDPVKEAKAVGDAAIAAAQSTGKRLVVVGGAGSLNMPDGTPVLDKVPEGRRAEPTAMRNVLDSLKASSVDWTFFSPAGSISTGKKTGKYQLGTTTLLSDADGKSRISAEDYADALVNELEKPAHRKGQMTIAY